MSLTQHVKEVLRVAEPLVGHAHITAARAVVCQSCNGRQFACMHRETLHQADSSLWRIEGVDHSPLHSGICSIRHAWSIAACSNTSSASTVNTAPHESREHTSQPASMRWQSNRSLPAYTLSFPHANNGNRASDHQTPVPDSSGPETRCALDVNMQPWRS